MPTIRPGPRRQHDDAVGDEHRLGDRVGDEQHGRRQRFAQPGQEVAHVGAGDLVEGGERLVHQQQRRAERHRPHEGDALLHAARQLVRVGVGEVAEADLGEQLDGVRAAVATATRRLTSSSSRALAATVRHGSRAGDWGTNPMRLADAGVVGAGAVDGDPAAGRFVEPADDAQQRRLAAAAGPEHRDDLAGRDDQVDRIQRLDGPEGLGDAHEFDGRRHAWGA